MKKTASLLLLSSFFFSSAVTAQKNISFYRNDGFFHQMKLEDGVNIDHIAGNDGIEVSINDWLWGAMSIPLSAIDSCIVRTGDIPVLRLSFRDYPTISSLWEKDLFLNANLKIEGRGFTDDVPSLLLQVKGRGNSTWEMPKKPMRLKFPKKIALCGLRKSKNFVLLNNYLDPTLMRNAIALWLANRLGMTFSNSIVPCHVFINDNYAGAYTLSEKIDISESSVDMDEKMGMLFELSLEYDEKYKFRSETLNLPVMVKAPDFDELFDMDPETEKITPQERLDIWKEDFNKAELLASQGCGAEAFDIESAVNYYILYKLTNNHEIGFPKSMYIHKFSLDENEKYHFGPAWDFDVAFNFSKLGANGQETQISPYDDTGFVSCSTLLQCLINTPEFKEIYDLKVKEFQEHIFPELMDFFDKYADMIEPSAKINGMKWAEIGSIGWCFLNSSYDTATHVKQLRDWLTVRASALNLRLKEDGGLRHQD